MSVESEKEFALLFERYHERRSIYWRNRIVEKGRYLAFQAAKSLRIANWRDAEFQDRVSLGYIGLIAAVEEYDPKRFPRFEAFAVKAIKNKILNLLQVEHDGPARDIGKSKKLWLAERSLADEGVHNPTSKELGERLGVSDQKVLEWQEAARRSQPASIFNNKTDETRYNSLIMRTECKRTPTPLQELIKQEKSQEATERIFGDLNLSEVFVIKCYFYNNRDYDDIASELNLPKYQVISVFNAAMGKIARRYGGEFKPIPEQEAEMVSRQRAAIKEYMCGTPSKVLADALGSSDGYIRGLAILFRQFGWAGVPSKCRSFSGNRKYWPDSVRQECVLKVLSGQNANDVARDKGMHVVTLRKWVKAYREGSPRAASVVDN